MGWVDVSEERPLVGQYVLCCTDDLYFISRWDGDEWEVEGNMRRRVYSGSNRYWSSVDPQYWRRLDK